MWKTTAAKTPMILKNVVWRKGKKMGRKEHKPVVLSLLPCGSSVFPRYRIVDSHARFYTGEGWSQREEEGLVYEDSNLGCHKMQQLLLLPYKHLPVRQFRAPVYLDLYSDHQSFSKLELEEWLVKVAKLLIDPSPLGNAPFEESLGLLRVNWSEIEEVKSRDRKV